MRDTKIALTRKITDETASENTYDAVIVGAGIAGSIIANELSKQGKRVLIVEAGPGKDFSTEGFRAYLERFYSATSKDNQSPYKYNPNASMPRSIGMNALRPGVPNTEGYWVQNGPFVSDSTYTRVVGGTTMHWEGKTIRMLREDFKMHTTHGVGLDWPIELDELMPYYRRAEFEIGVSGDVEGQKRVGAEFEEGYVYPMLEMPPSYLDKVVAKGFSGMEVELDGQTYALNLETFPQGRNGIPNEDYKIPKKEYESWIDGKKGANSSTADAGNGISNKTYKSWNEEKVSVNFAPVGAVSLHQEESGERCQGNTNCVPLCPIQAKFDARKILTKALQAKAKVNGEDKYYVDLIHQAVASRVIIDPDSGKVAELEIKIYKETDDPTHSTTRVRGTVFILAANAVETARLMLASGLPSTSGLMGRNLMDHPYLLSWALLPEIAGVGNGPVVTSGICNLRRGPFRKHQAAFATDIHNDGWGWATGGGPTNLINTVDNLNKFGKTLRNEMVDQISKQLLLAYMVEMPPEYSNRVSVDPGYKDALGNLRPVVSYQIPDYSMKAMEFARQLSKMIFQRLGAEDYTYYDPLDYGYVNYNGAGYAIRGGNHLAGTHIMGTTKHNSVVNSYQKSWDHANLYLVGAGSMPTIGTSNTTLTLSALCFRSIEAILQDLK